MVLLWLALVGCTDSESVPDAAPAASPLAEGWIPTLAREPGLFADLAGGAHRDGWIALHRGDYETAAARLSGAGAHRAKQDLATFDEDMVRLADQVWLLTFEQWEQQGTFEGGRGALVPALAAIERGDTAEQQRWLALVEAGQTPGWTAAHSQALAAQRYEDLDALPCLAAHGRVRAGAPLADLGDCGTQPLIASERSDKPSLWDPLVFRTRAAVHARHLGTAPRTGGDLADLLFGPFWSAMDRQAAVDARRAESGWGAGGPTLAALGLTQPSPAGDDFDWARERVRALDAALDDWRNRALSDAAPEGKNLLVELDLVGGWRSRVLMAWAREALHADHPQQALAYLQLAQDAQAARRITARNPPSLFALMAEAELRSGRTRQALDALQVLADTFPWVEGLDETAGDLVVLAGLGRQGDSKEN